MDCLDIMGNRNIPNTKSNIYVKMKNDEQKLIWVGFKCSERLDIHLYNFEYNNSMFQQSTNEHNCFWVNCFNLSTNKFWNKGRRLK